MVDWYAWFSQVVAIQHFVRRSRDLEAADLTTNSIRRPLLLEDVALLESNAIRLGSRRIQTDRWLSATLRNEDRFHPGRSRHLRVAPLTPKGWLCTKRKWYHYDAGWHCVDRDSDLRSRDIWGIFFKNEG